MSRTDHERPHQCAQLLSIIIVHSLNQLLVMQIQEYINIDRPADVVFEYLIDVNNRSDYVPALEEVVMIDPLPLGEGTRYIEVATIGGRRLETTYQITAFQNNERLSAKTLKSIFPIQVDLLLNEKDNTTLLLINLNFTLKGIFKIASGIVSGIVRSQARGILTKVKKNIEG